MVDRLVVLVRGVSLEKDRSDSWNWVLDQTGIFFD